MTLPVSGSLALGQVNLELGYPVNTQISLGSPIVRGLYGVPLGAVALAFNGYGKSSIISIVISEDTADYVLNPTTYPGYFAGYSNFEITVNTGVYVYATTSSSAGITINAGATGDTFKIINNGYIMGKGGDGANSNAGPTIASPAINTFMNVIIVNNSYIGGGGGGGGTAVTGAAWGGGGGGAGGGAGGIFYNLTTGELLIPGGTGGAPGAAGTDGNSAGFNTNVAGGGGAGGGGGGVAAAPSGAGTQLTPRPMSGAGGGRIFPGVGGIAAVGEFANGGAGGSAGNPGGTGQGGGGGGWGASGGSSTSSLYAPTAGGKAINLNGKTATRSGSGTTYGAVS